MEKLGDRIRWMNELYGKLSKARMTDNTEEYQWIYDSFMISIREIKQELRKITNCSDYIISDDDRIRRSENMKRNRYRKNK